MECLPALLRRDVNHLERDVLSLPARLGGLGIPKPNVECVNAHASHHSSSSFCAKINILILKIFAWKYFHGRNQIDQETERLQKIKLEQLLEKAPPQLQLAMKTTIEKGASSWVTSTPLHEHGTVLHKGDFVDAVYMRYGWTLADLPASCPCGTAFSLQHALDCKLGGYRTIQHNEVRDLFVDVMREAGHVVEAEPLLQKLTGEGFKYKSANKENDARSDLKVTGFWRNMRQAYFDVKVVSPFARSYSHLTQKSILLTAEKSKMREYAERIKEIEQADFNPLVFTTVGAMGNQSQIVMKRLVEQLSERKGVAPSVVTGWLRVRLSFALLRTTLLCVRGTRRKKFTNCESNIDLAVSQAKIAY
jgi:hypothetical protein